MLIRGAAANNSWHYYGGCASEHVMTYLIQIKSSQNHVITGNILELDFHKHLDFLNAHSVDASLVEVVFKNPNHVRTFSMKEWNELTYNIAERYGVFDRKHFLVENEQALQWAIEQARYTFRDMAEERTADDYISELEQHRFTDYGYTHGDKVFATPNDAEDALRNSLNVFALCRDGSAMHIGDHREIESHRDADGIFGMSREEMDFLRYLQLGKSTPTLFTGDELREIYCHVVQAGMCNSANEPKVLDSVLYKLERTMPPIQAAENEMDQEIQFDR